MKEEELSPKDLRIGNIVNYKYFNPHPEKHECCFTKVVIRGVHESSIRISFPKQKHIENVSKVYGIPLTEEVLLKCGFEKDETYVSEEHPWADWIKNDVVISLPYFEFNFESSEVEIKHLHQLQNLYYALTGEELEVSL